MGLHCELLLLLLLLCSYFAPASAPAPSLFLLLFLSLQVKCFGLDDDLVGDIEAVEEEEEIEYTCLWQVRKEGQCSPYVPRVTSLILSTA